MLNKIIQYKDLIIFNGIKANIDTGDSMLLSDTQNEVKFYKTSMTEHVITLKPVT